MKDGDAVSEEEYDEALSGVNNGIEIMQENTSTEGLPLSDLLAYLEG